MKKVKITKEEYEKLLKEGKVKVMRESNSSSILVDYKSYNSATKPTSIPPYYKQQLLVYAWVLKQLGRSMERIRLVYVNRPIDTRRTSEKT